MELTDLILKIPDDFYGRVFVRSGLVLKYGITAHNGVVDSDFRGVLCIVLFSNSDKDYQVLSGQRITQTIFNKTETVKFIEVTDIEKNKEKWKRFQSNRFVRKNHLV